MGVHTALLTPMFCRQAIAFDATTSEVAAALGYLPTWVPNSVVVFLAVSDLVHFFREQELKKVERWVAATCPSIV